MQDKSYSGFRTEAIESIWSCFHSHYRHDHQNWTLITLQWAY